MKKGEVSSEEPEAKRYAGAGGREKKLLRRKILGSQCFSTPNEMRQPRDALLLTPRRFRDGA